MTDYEDTNQLSLRGGIRCVSDLKKKKITSYIKISMEMIKLLNFNLRFGALLLMTSDPGIFPRQGSHMSQHPIQEAHKKVSSKLFIRRAQINDK